MVIKCQSGVSPEVQPSRVPPLDFRGCLSPFHFFWILFLRSNQLVLVGAFRKKSIGRLTELAPAGGPPQPTPRPDQRDSPLGAIRGTVPAADSSQRRPEGPPPRGWAKRTPGQLARGPEANRPATTRPDGLLREKEGGRMSFPATRPEGGRLLFTGPPVRGRTACRLPANRATEDGCRFRP